LVRVDARGEDGTDEGWASLTDAELRVISRVSQGKSNRWVAEELSVSRHTVDAHLKHIYLKLDVHSRVELTVLALQNRPPIG
jgi:DNA-binding CsgD family transcriptional regulator